MKCVAVDDEPLALDLIEDYIGKVRGLELVGAFDNPMLAYDFLKKNDVDLIFLDIQMDVLTGIQLLNILKKKPLVIFATAFDKYALQGYELDAVDYLLKPFSFERFLRAYEKALERFEFQRGNSTETHTCDSAVKSVSSCLFVKSEHQIHRIEIDDILYIEGMGDYLKIVTLGTKIMVLHNFKYMESALPKTKFYRVHKSYIVSLEKIQKIEKNNIHINGAVIPISEKYKSQFFDALNVV